MKKLFWQANLTAAAVAIALFGLMAGVLRWNLIGAFLLAAGIFLGLAVLLNPHDRLSPQEGEGPSPFEGLEQKLERFQVSALQCRELRLRDAGRSLYNSARSVLDYLQAVPEKAAMVQQAPWQGLAGLEALTAQYLKRESDKELGAAVLKMTAELDRAFSGQLERLLQTTEPNAEEPHTPCRAQG